MKDVTTFVAISWSELINEVYRFPSIIIESPKLDGELLDGLLSESGS